MMTSPLISVIIPCYNQAQYLDECLQSVQDQTFQNWECIIVNDGSLDNTEEVALQWTNKDSRFIYLKKENGGLSSARNFGLKKANGSWIQFLDSDDKIHPDKFKTAEALFDKHKLIVSQFETFTNSSFYPPYTVIKSNYLLFENILLGWDMDYSIPIHCAVINIELLKDFKFDESLKSCEDWPMWLHITYKSPSFIVIEAPHAYYRKGSTSMSSDLIKIVDQRLKIFPKIKKLYGDHHHDTLMYKIIRKRSIDNLNHKTELQKLQKTKVLQVYHKIRKFFN